MCMLSFFWDLNMLSNSPVLRENDVNHKTTFFRKAENCKFVILSSFRSCNIWKLIYNLDFHKLDRPELKKSTNL